MQKPEMLKKVSEKATEIAEKKVTQKEVECILSAYAEMVKEELASNKEEKIPMIGIGSFTVKHVAEKDGEMNGMAWHKDAEDQLAFKINKSVKTLA